MRFSEALVQEQKESDEWLARWRSKYGDYTGDECPNCGRVRVMKGADGKRRCQKCCWCIEDAQYDDDLMRNR